MLEFSSCSETTLYFRLKLDSSFNQVVLLFKESSLTLICELLIMLVRYFYLCWRFSIEERGFFLSITDISRQLVYNIDLEFKRSIKMKLFLLLILVINTTALVLFTRSSIFGAFQVKLYNTNNDLISASSNKRFTFPNTYNYQNLNVIGMAFNGFKSPSINKMSFTAQPTYSFNNNSVIITVIQSKDSTFNYMTYSIIFVSSTASDIIDLQNPCFNVTTNMKFNFISNLVKGTTDSVQIVPYIRSITNSQASNLVTFNATSFSMTNSNVSLFINMAYSNVTSFCLSVVLVHFTKLKGYTQYNASYSSGALNSSNPLLTIQSTISKNFGILNVYGPVFDQKCVIGFLTHQFTTKYNQQFSFNFSYSPMGNITTSSTYYYIEYSTLCFVQLQCQYLFQTYYVLINDCQNACKISNCLNCTTSTSCASCQSGYFVNGLLRCSPCIANCLNCSTTTTCINCQGGYYYNTTSQACMLCPANCLTCTSTSCTNCIAGYFILASRCSACQSSMPNCLSCAVATMCTGCQTGYFYAPSQSGCISCTNILNCRLCTSASTCTNCITGYYLVNSRCSLCTPDALVCCSQYVANCIRCSSSTSCSACATGYFFAVGATVFNKCIACIDLIPNCQICVSNTNCTQCLKGWYSNGDNTQCLSCAVSIPNCAACYSADICFSCQSSYQVQEGVCQSCGDENTADQYYVQNNICTLCSIGIQNCYRCVSDSTCLQCNSGYYNLNGSCVICGSVIQNCLLCDDPNTCLACSYGNYLINSQCKACSTAISGCVNCNMTGGNVECLQCSQQTFMEEGSCKLCSSKMDKCQRCNGPSLCIMCAPGYFLWDGICSLCQRSNCLTCISQEICTVCKSGFYISNGACNNCTTILGNCVACNSTWCFNCSSGFYRSLNGTCENCFKIIPNCVSCSSSASCTSCLTGYYLVPNSTACVVCPSTLTNCLTCSSQTSCTTCLDLFFQSSSGSCISCSIYIKSCIDCNSATTCLRCRQGFYLIDVAPSSVVNNVKINPSNITNNCSGCAGFIDNCLDCLNNTSCTTCAIYYFVSPQGRCSLCANFIPNCLICSSSSVCTSCVQNYLVSSDGQCISCTPLVLNCKSCAAANSPYQCGECTSGYYLSNGGCTSCSSAINNCIVCPSSTLCQQCQKGYYPADSNRKCLKCVQPCAVCTDFSICSSCQDGYYLSNSTNACASCPSNCQTCNSSSFCTVCKKTYYINSQYQCSNCSLVDTGCLVCSNSTHCTIYSSSSATSETVSFWAYIALVGASLIALLLLIMLFYCIWKTWCRKKQSEEAKTKETVVGISEREIALGIKGKREKDFQIQHDGLCQLCKNNKLQVMNIQLLCFKCEQQASHISNNRSDRTNRLRKQIAIGSYRSQDEKDTA